MGKRSNYSRYIASATAAEYANDPQKRARREFLQTRRAARMAMLDELSRTDHAKFFRLAHNTPENMRELDALIREAKGPSTVEAWIAAKREDEGRFSPCVDQAPEEIAAHYRNASIGAAAAARYNWGGSLHYEFDEVDGLRPEIGRVYFRRLGAFFLKSGIKYDRRSVTMYLVIPTDAVIAFAKEHPHGAPGYSFWRRIPHRSRGGNERRK